jgi:Na+/melibiose symporter-like transporter
VTVTASREAAGLVGVLLSAALLLPERAHWLVALFIATAILAAVALLRAPNPRPLPPDDLQSTARAEAAASAWLAGWQEAFARGAFRRLLAIFLCNGIASAIPATLVLFYVGDVLGAPDRAPLFLMAYFLAAAVGMPLWTRLAARLGLRRTWLLGMGLSVAGFIWAFALGPGDTTPFLIVCLVTGLALGADLAIPPAMLATVLSDAPGERAREGTYFGLWNLATKLNLAAAAGVALPLLGLLGYVPGQSSEHTLSLSATYALLPCVLKLAAVGLLSTAKLPASCDRPS